MQVEEKTAMCGACPGGGGYWTAGKRSTGGGDVMTRNPCEQAS